MSEREPRIRVVHEDASLVAFDKPSGLLTIPGRLADSASLWRLAEAVRGERLWPVHRLDRDTSGVVVFARSAAIHRTLNLAFEGRAVKKRYLAQVAPPPRVGEGTLTHTLVPARRGFMRLGKVGEPGVTAETRYRVLESVDNRALVELFPVTGRTHQLRLQLATIGAPIVGEPHYRCLDGDAPLPSAAERLWLHAANLELDHPLDGAQLAIAAPTPDGLWPPRER